MTFAQLRTFALVAELGSLRAAATALGVSEPAVSAAVAALRADLGDPLFRRTGTGISLTPGGRALATRARELVRLAYFEQLTQIEIAERLGLPLGTVKSRTFHALRTLRGLLQETPAAA